MSATSPAPPPEATPKTLTATSLEATAINVTATATRTTATAISSSATIAITTGVITDNWATAIPGTPNVIDASIHPVLEDTVRTKEANQLEALRNVQAFLDDHQNRLPSIATSGARRQLDEALARHAQHADDQTSSAAWSRNCTKRYHALRHRLIRSHLVPIALIARTTRPPLSELAQFRIPRGKPTAQQLAAAAHAMAEAAAPYAATFIAAGMPKDFIDQLEKASDAMMAELEARAQERARHRIATEALRSGITSARRIVQVLDAFVRSACELDVEMIAGWESVTHVRRSAHRAEALSVDSREPLQLVVTGAPEVRAELVSEHESSANPPVALPRRVLELLAVHARVRLAVGA